MNKRMIATYTGRLVDFLNPDRNQICIMDIAHALANICRYNGHTSRFYSVAEHCVRMSFLEGDKLAYLLHDAAEAYIGDIPSPQKPYLRILGPSEGNDWPFREIERGIQQVIGSALGIPDLVERTTTREVKRRDTQLFAEEVDTLMSDKAQDLYALWIPVDLERIPIDFAQHPYGENYKSAFLRRYYELKE